MSSSLPGEAEEDFEEEEEEELSDSEAIPPLDLDSMAGSEPIPSSVLKGRQLVSGTARHGQTVTGGQVGRAIWAYTPSSWLHARLYIIYPLELKWRSLMEV